jgi:hypothetical protein
VLDLTPRQATILFNSYVRERNDLIDVLVRVVAGALGAKVQDKVQESEDDEDEFEQKPESEAMKTATQRHLAYLSKDNHG